MTELDIAHTATVRVFAMTIPITPIPQAVKSVGEPTGVDTASAALGNATSVKEEEEKAGDNGILRRGHSKI